MAPGGPPTHRQRLICEQQGPGYGAKGHLIEYMQDVCVCKTAAGRGLGSNYKVHQYSCASFMANGYITFKEVC